MPATAEIDVAAENKMTALEVPHSAPSQAWSELDHPNSERARAKALFESQYIKLHELRKNV